MSNSSNTTHQGKVVSVSGNQVTSTCSDGEQHVHEVNKETRVTCDGKDSKVAQLKSGDTIRVTMSGKDTVVSIDSGKLAPVTHGKS
jgi:hypothetical protein